MPDQKIGDRRKKREKGSICEKHDQCTSEFHDPKPNAASKMLTLPLPNSHFFDVLLKKNWGYILSVSVITAVNVNFPQCLW